MTEINTGVSSPGGINGLLLWQQVSIEMCLLDLLHHQLIW